MTSFRLILRWSWRDLRAHWAKVVAIALVIGIGIGGYAGLTSNANWRRASYEASYASLNMFDVKVSLTSGAFVPEGSLREMVAGLSSSGSVQVVQERLLVPTQVDASDADQTILVRSQIIGSDLASGGPHVNSYHVWEGRPLAESDIGEPTVLLERAFAGFYDLPASGQIEVSGNRHVEFVGLATSPEFFAVVPPGEIYGSEANYAVLFTSLETAQLLSGRPDVVNDAVLTLVEGADRAAFAEELAAALVGHGVAADVSTRDDDAAYSMLTTDVENDQQVFNVFAFVLFVGAVGAAFNLIHRLAEQQRREFGVSMALGIRPGRIAVRPLLVSAQIALLGVVFGVGVGMLIGSGVQSVFEQFIPLPVWETTFQTTTFAAAAVIGFVVPFVATAFPIINAVRVTPVEAIRPPHLSSGRDDGRTRRSFSVNTFAVMPFRNMVRHKRRTALTTLGIAAVITILVSMLGMIDSFVGTLDAAEHEALGENEDRVTVTLDGFYPTASEQVRSVESAASVGAGEAVVRVGASLTTTSDDFDVLLEVLDLDGELWSPTLVAGALDTGAGLVLAEKAAGDLGIEVGEAVTVGHPRVGPDGTVSLVDTDLPLLAVHASPLRSAAYLDSAHADVLGMAGLTNLLYVEPGTHSTLGDVQREMFDLDAVASVQSVASAMQVVQDQMEAFTGVLQVMVVAALALALLIAFNTASINLDARAREHATMFAYGIRIRTALRMAMTESAVMGVAATVVGVAAGLAMLLWLTKDIFASTMPELGVDIALLPGTIVTVVLLGVIAVTLAPALTVPRMRRMDIPGTLRLVE